jgi:16S rRNA (adenine1518-N6/adenine1519-N6)-dimethyltransferase
MRICDLPPVSEMMRAAGLEPKKQMGQNFLFDLNLTRKIARSVPDIESAALIEVGPGPGGLTRALLECGAPRVIAIEKDRAAEPILREIQKASAGRLEIIFGDALKIFSSSPSLSDACGLAPGSYAMCSNLPYNVGTELLIRWLHIMSRQDYSAPGALRLSSLTLMFQREVAERIVARPGDNQYGRLKVLAGLVADAKILFNVPAAAFFPTPKVQSAVVQIVPKKSRVTPQELCAAERLAARLFGRRRKMIRSIMPDADWARFGLTGQERAQELSPEKFVEIAGEIVL